MLKKQTAGKLALYYNSFSQPSRAVKCFLKIGKIDFDEKPLNLGKKENTTPEMLALNWTGKVPFIVDPSGFSVFESHTVMRYLHALYKMNDNLYPADIQSRAKVDMYLDWHHSNTRRMAHTITTTVLSKRTKETVTLYNETLVANEMNSALKNLNDHLLNNSSHYINGLNSPTIADLSCYFELSEAIIIDRDLQEYPNIIAFQKKMREIPEVLALDEEFLLIYNKIFKKKFNS